MESVETEVKIELVMQEKACFLNEVVSLGMCS